MPTTPRAPKAAVAIAYPHDLGNCGGCRTCGELLAGVWRPWPAPTTGHTP
jgi:hypothetical protein